MLLSFAPFAYVDMFNKIFFLDYHNVWRQFVIHFLDKIILLLPYLGHSFLHCRILFLLLRHIKQNHEFMNTPIFIPMATEVHLLISHKLLTGVIPFLAFCAV